MLENAEIGDFGQNITILFLAQDRVFFTKNPYSFRVLFVTGAKEPLTGWAQKNMNFVKNGPLSPRPTTKKHMLAKF